MSVLNPGEFIPLFRAAAAARRLVESHWLDTAAGPVCVWSTHDWDAGAPTGLISAGIHGDEPAGPLALLRYLQHHELPRGWNWVLAPMLNPEGCARGTRGNNAGTDLNRDFRFARTPEVQAFRRWWGNDHRRCDFHVSLHEDWETDGFYLYEINSSARPCFARGILDAMAPRFPLQADGPVDGHELAAPGFISHPADPDEPDGWPEAIWIVRHFPALSHTYEAPSSKPLDLRVDMLHFALGAALRHIAEAPDQR